MILSDMDREAGKKLQIVNTRKLDNELQKDKEYYVGINGANGSGFKYERFKRFLNTSRRIIVPDIYLKKSDNGKITTYVHDGRHRFAVLRDMGLIQIPVSMDDESIALAEEINLL